MEFTFKLTREDWKPCLKVVNRHLTVLAKANSKAFVANLLAWIPLGVAIATYAALYRKYPALAHDLNVVAIATVVGVFLVVASMIFKQQVYRKASISESGTFLVAQTVEANSKALGFKSAFGVATYPWDCFLHRAEDEARIYLFVDNALAVVIPKSAVGSPDQLAELRQWARLGEP